MEYNKHQDPGFRFIRFWLFVLFYRELANESTNPLAIDYDTLGTITDHICDTAYKRGLMGPIEDSDEQLELVTLH